MQYSMQVYVYLSAKNGQNILTYGTVRQQNQMPSKSNILSYNIFTLTQIHGCPI